MLGFGLEEETFLQIIRQEFNEVYERAILPEIDRAKAQLPYLMGMNVSFPRKMQLVTNYFKSTGDSGAFFFVAAEARNVRQTTTGKYDCDVRLTVVARVKTGQDTSFVAFTGDDDAIYIQHFFERYILREEIKEKIRPEKLYLSVLSDERMWKTVESVYNSNYGYSYIRPWDRGIALGIVLDGGEIRKTYISRKLMRHDQDLLCQALLYIGDIRRLYGFIPEQEMERTMIKFRHGGIHAEQITKYFKYYWQAQRIPAFLEGDIVGFDRETRSVANRFFRSYGLPLEYGRDCMIRLSKPMYFDELREELS